jgi:carboxypeptidase family protein
MRGRNLCVGLVCLFVSLSLPTASWAQNLNASLTGQVTDQTGAAVPNAALVLTSVATGAVSNAASGPDGSYSFPNLRPGIYNLKASAQGFRDYIQTGIELAMNANASLDVKLQLGTTVQTVEVAANVSPLNTTNAEQRGSISPEVLQNLPIEVLGTVRSAANFAILMPGVTTGGGGNPFDARINGGLQSGDEAILDGVSLAEGLMSQSGMVSIQTDFPTSPDMVSELSVLTSNYEPQYGSTTSGQIILETKSGTNQLHGVAYEYLRNTALNARQFGTPNRAADLEHEFGGGLGGPVLIPHVWGKEKRTFFYLNMTGFRAGGSVASPIFSVPTMQERIGDFRDWVDSSGKLIPVYDPDTLTVNPNFNPNQLPGPNNEPYFRTQFNGCPGTPQLNVICPSDPRLVNSLAAAWFKFIPPPTPGVGGLFNNYVGRARPEELLFHTNYFDLRVDQYVRDKDHFSASVYYQGAHPNTISQLPVQVSADNDASPEYAFVDRLNWDHTVSPTLLNHMAMGYHNREEGYGSLNAKYASDFPQIPGVATHNYPPVVSLGGYGTYGDNYGGPNIKNVTARPDYTINDLLTWVRGKHTIKIGGEYRWLAENNRGNYNGNCSPAGNFAFSAGETGLQGIKSGSEIASFLLGQVDSGCATFFYYASNYPRAAAYIAHIGDTWKATPKLSINYGLRWDTFTPSVEKHDEASFLDPFRPNPSAGGRPGSLVFAGSKWGPASFGRRAPELTWNKGFAPRLGIAYTVTPKTVVRTGYGMFFTQMFYPGWGGGILQDGFYAIPSFGSTIGGLQAAFLLQKGLPQTFQRPPFIDPGYLNGQGGPNYRAFDSNRRPYSQQWNFTIEHEFTNNFYFDVAYVANKGTRMPSRTVPINALDPKYLSKGQALYDSFIDPNTGLELASVDGVPIPYAGWTSQMQACSPEVAQALRPYPQYCNSLYSVTENAGNTTYHAFQAKVEKRYTNGLWTLTSYTLEKTLGDADQTQADALTWSGAHGVISPFERKRNKALAVDDVPQTLSEALVYDLPFGRGKRWGGNHNKVVNGFIGGWTLATVLRVSSGIPFFFRSSYCNVPGELQAQCIPGVLPGMSPFAQSKSNFNPNLPLFNPSAFEAYDPTLGYSNFNFSLGQGPRISNYRGFGYHNHDITIMKRFRITEKADFQLRGEFFNIWNWHTYNCPTQCWGYGAFDTSVGDSNFGMWNGTVTLPRNIQVAGRLTF